jgi:periplasmic protein TonB
MPMLEQNGSTEVSGPPPPAAFEQQQRRRMLIALLVLLLALISVLIKDRQFWFPSSPSAESETPEQSEPQASPPAKALTPVAPPKVVTPAPARPRPKSKRVAARAPSTGAESAMSPVITATNRAVLPSLQVEVVAGNQHRSVSPGDSSVKLEMQPSTAEASEQPAVPARSQDSEASNAATQVQLSPGSAQVVSRVNPTYPLLAKQMKVQGAVILEALIGKSGSIQDIQVLSGPAILSAAAREAVKQWHFKPYYQGGRPVETEARITVNFTISTY